MSPGYGQRHQYSCDNHDIVGRTRTLERIQVLRMVEELAADVGDHML